MGAELDLLRGVHRALRLILIRRGAKSVVGSVLGERIHYYRLEGRGTGPPVLLVHGLGGSANGFYKILLPLGARFQRVFALDLPGHGFSPPPEPGWTLRRSFELLAAFCEQVVRERVFAIGNSLGGALCLALASERPELVRALALLAPAGARLDAEQVAEISAALRVENAAQARALTRRLFHRAPLSALLFASLAPRMYGTAAVRGILAKVDADDFLPPEALERIAVPTLLLWGKGEKLLPFEAVQYFREHLPPQARIEILEGFGHLPQFERPRELVQRLIAFADQGHL